MSDGGKLHADNFKQDHLMTEIIKIVKADLNSLQHTHAIIDLLNAYASGQMGGNHPLTDYVKENLIGEFKKGALFKYCSLLWEVGRPVWRFV